MPSTSRVQLQQGWDVFLAILAAGVCLVVLLLAYIHELEGRQAGLQAPQEASQPPLPAAAEPPPLTCPPARHDQPPIITLKESEGYTFAFGSTEVSEPFRTNLIYSVIPRLLEISKRYQVTVVEVIGHTDDVPLRGYVSNLDITLVPFLNRERDEVRASDNVGLGMARAVAVLKLLRDDSRLSGLSFVPYSAGQLVRRGDHLSEGSDRQPQAERRRIEISLRKPR
jgi:outer membrane protein OmpA-like peptidoglycan-associated protein